MRLVAYIILILPFFLLGCISDPKPVSPISFEQCSKAKYCTLKGTISIHWANHVKMGKLDMGEGKCIDISLSDESIAYFEKNPNSQTIISGKVFPYFHDETVTMLTVNGRRVGMTLCNPFYVFAE